MQFKSHFSAQVLFRIAAILMQLTAVERKVLLLHAVKSAVH